MRILFIGDIYGQKALDYLVEKVPFLKSEYKPNLIIANAENSGPNGRSITHAQYKQLMKSGINYLTMGNHTFKHHELETFIKDANIIKPLNDGINLGVGYKIVNYNDKKLLIINALGTVGMAENYESAFLKIKEILTTQKYDYSLLDFHAEMTSEKIALAYYLDGLVDVVIGTHTHVQTNDARKLPQGTLYITDVGMTGALHGVIGVDAKIIIDRFINGYTVPNKIAEGKNQLNAVIIELSPKRLIQTIHIED